MAWFGGVFAVIGFISLAKYFGLTKKNKRVIEIAIAAVSIVQDTSISDDEKETIMQKYAKELFLHFLTITGLSILAISIPFLFIWFFELAGLSTVKTVIDTMQSLEFIAITAIGSIVLLRFGAKQEA
jgi:hypothetical protein